MSVNLETIAIDGNQNQSALPRNQSVRSVYDEQFEADGNRSILNLLRENSCSKWMEQNAAREEVDLKCGEKRSKRSRNFTA